MALQPHFSSLLSMSSASSSEQLLTASTQLRSEATCSAFATSSARPCGQKTKSTALAVLDAFDALAMLPVVTRTRRRSEGAQGSVKSPSRQR